MDVGERVAAGTSTAPRRALAQAYSKGVALAVQTPWLEGKRSGREMLAKTTPVLTQWYEPSTVAARDGRCPPARQPTRRAEDQWKVRWAADVREEGGERSCRPRGGRRMQL